MRLTLTDMRWLRSPWAPRGIILAGLLLVVLGARKTLQLFTLNPEYPEGTDLGLYLRAGRYAIAGINPYSRDVNSGFDIYGYPPLLADIMGILTNTIGVTATGIVWPILCALSLCGAIALILRGFGARVPWHWIMLAIGVVSLGRVVRADIYHGQVNVIILLLLVGGLMLHDRKRTVAAAACFAVCMSLKPFFGIIVFYFLARKEWRLALWSLALGATVFFASFLPLAGQFIESFLGWRAASEYLISGASGARGDNQSMYGMFIRMFSETPFSTPWLNAPALIRVGTGLAVLLMCGITWYSLSSPRDAVRRLLPERSVVRMLECMAILAISIGCGPYAEGDHIFFALAGATGTVVLMLERRDGERLHEGLWLATAVSWLCLVGFLVLPMKLWLTLGTYDTWKDLHGWQILLSGRNGFLLILAGALTLITLGRERRSVAQGTRAR
jgi:Glycosyltransferase family 87